jgi:hypothetical protein
MRSRSRTLVSVGLVGGLVLAAGAATLLPGTATPAAAEALPPYASCDALLAHYRAELERTATPYGLGGGDVLYAARGGAEADMAVAASAEQAAPVAPGPTGTNLQESGVDEPDVAKTVRGLLFAISERGLEVVRTGAKPALLGRAPLEGDSWGAELLVDGDRVLVLAPGLGPRTSGRRATSRPRADRPDVRPDHRPALRRRGPGGAAAAGAPRPRRPLPVGPAVRAGRSGWSPPRCPTWRRAAAEPYGRPRRPPRWPATGSWPARRRWPTCFAADPAWRGRRPARVGTGRRLRPGPPRRVAAGGEHAAGHHARPVAGPGRAGPHRSHHGRRAGLRLRRAAVRRDQPLGHRAAAGRRCGAACAGCRSR